MHHCHVEAMDSSLISALAALIGASVGGLTSVLASWLLHQRQVRVQWVAQEANRRRDLYKEFIEDASKCYVDALQHDTGDIPALFALHATDRSNAHSFVADCHGKR